MLSCHSNHDILRQNGQADQTQIFFDLAAGKLEFDAEKLIHALKIKEA